MEITCAYSLVPRPVRKMGMRLICAYRFVGGGGGGGEGPGGQKHGSYIGDIVYLANNAT